MALGSIAQTLIKMELGRQITKAEVMEIINRNQEEGLVLLPSNTQKIEFLCACCGCCCAMLSLHKELPLARTRVIAASNANLFRSGIRIMHAIKKTLTITVVLGIVRRSFDGPLAQLVEQLTLNQ